MKTQATMLVAAMFLAGPAQAVVIIDFESYPDGTVQARVPDGTSTISPMVSGTNPDAQAWSQRSSADEEVLDIGGSHGRVWRLSDRGDTGNLQTRPHSPHAGDLTGSPGTKQFSGETGAIDDFGSETPTTSKFYTQMDFRSATGTAQTDLQINIAPTCGDDCRQAFIRFVDDGTGFDVVLFETMNASFVSHSFDLNLSYTDWHTLAIEIDFVDGLASGSPGAPDDAVGNDIVKYFIDDMLIFTGTSWESFYADRLTNLARGIDRVQFYSNNASNADVDGGMYFDNILISDVAPAVAAPEPGTLAIMGLGMLGLAFRRRGLS